MRKKIIILIPIIILVVIIVSFLVFRNVHLGYDKTSMIYDKTDGNQTIELGIPKLSFMAKENDKSYSFKNIRSNRVIKKEIKEFLETLEPTQCNNTTYYYDKENDFTIIDYSVKNYFFYNTISYRVSSGSYCFLEKVKEYGNLLGGSNRFHTLNSEFKLSEDVKFEPRLVVAFLDNTDVKNQQFNAKLDVYYLSPIPNEWKSVARKEIESSTGTFEIKDDKLYYTRTEIKKSSDDVKIPNVSIFSIDNGKLVLIDDYLSTYTDIIELK